MSIYDKASLVLIPSGTKTSKVYSQKPTNGDGDFTFSRSTAATRVNASGNIEKETQNLLTYSNTFDQWSTSGTYETGGQSGYDGSNDAWLLSKAANSYTYSSIAVSGSGVMTYSVYAKQGSIDNMTIYADHGTASYLRWNLNTNAFMQGSNMIDYGSVDVGGGWYRVWFAFNAGSLIRVLIYPDFNGTTAGDIYIQDAQLEQGLVARDYIETTTTAIYGGITDNVPRLDYTDSSCPALLLEPQRTNQVEQSEYGGSTYWSPLNSTITDNAAISPEGVQNAFELTDNSTDGYHWIYRGGLDSGNNHRISFFAKANTLTEVWANGGSGTKYAGFNLSNGTIFSQGVDSNATIEDYGNGWYRCSFTSDYSGLLIAASKNGDTTYIGTGQSLYLYGIQSESAASYATSYIPTYGSAVTRNADAASDSSVTPTSNKATLYIEISGDDDETNRAVCYFNNAQGNYGYGLYFWGADKNKFGFNTWNSDSYGIEYSNIFNGSVHKIAAVFDFTDFTQNALFIDGVKQSISQVQGTTIQRPASKASLIAPIANQYPKQNVHQFLCFNSALTDQEAIDLTTI